MVIASYEFGKRILIQRRCAVCSGSGLVSRGGSGRLVKCTACGGFLPWVSWRLFLRENVRPGNGGSLRLPKGQTHQSGLLYDVDAAVEASRQMAARRGGADAAADAQAPEATAAGAGAADDRAAS